MKIFKWVPGLVKLTAKCEDHEFSHSIYKFIILSLEKKNVYYLNRNRLLSQDTIKSVVVLPNSHEIKLNFNAEYGNHISSYNVFIRKRDALKYLRKILEGKENAQRNIESTLPTKAQ